MACGGDGGGSIYTVNTASGCSWLREEWIEPFNYLHHAFRISFRLSTQSIMVGSIQADSRCHGRQRAYQPRRSRAKRHGLAPRPWKLADPARLSSQETTGFSYR